VCVVTCAVVASDQAVSNPEQARHLGHASVGVSIAGVIVTAIILIVLVSVFAAVKHSQ